jgi:hypothetical protein
MSKKIMSKNMFCEPHNLCEPCAICDLKVDLLKMHGEVFDQGAVAAMEAFIATIKQMPETLFPMSQGSLVESATGFMQYLKSGGKSPTIEAARPKR